MLHEQIAKRRKTIGLSQGQFAKICGWDQARQSHYETGRNTPSIEDLKAIASHLGTTVSVLIGETDETQSDNIVSLPLVQHERGGSSIPVPVPFYNIQAAAGGGNAVYTEEPDGVIYFTKGWIERKGLQYKSLVAIEADGESMLDYIHDGDVVLVDADRQEIISGRVYVFRIDNDLRIKRLFRNLNGTITVKSDNENDPRFISEIISQNDFEQLGVIGEVVWRGG